MAAYEQDEGTLEQIHGRARSRTDIKDVWTLVSEDPQHRTYTWDRPDGTLVRHVERHLPVSNHSNGGGWGISVSITFIPKDK